MGLKLITLGKGLVGQHLVEEAETGNGRVKSDDDKQVPHGAEKGAKGRPRVHTGSLWKSLAKGRMPASIMLAIVFRQLAKFNCHRSTIELSEVVNSRGKFPVALVRWERHCDQGNVFERGYSVLKLDSSEGRWKIAEGWTLDEPSQ